MVKVSRRGFFGRMLGRKTFKQACFALQIVIHADGIDDLRKQLHAMIDGPVDETPDEKRRYYKSLTALLKEAEPVEGDTPLGSNGGDTSTTSAPTSGRPRRPRSSVCACNVVNPPISGVPVPGANTGSRPSMSKER